MLLTVDVRCKHPYLDCLQDEEVGQKDKNARFPSGECMRAYHHNGYGDYNNNVTPRNNFPLT
jgi:hypothetical protein